MQKSRRPRELHARRRGRPRGSGRYPKGEIGRTHFCRTLSLTFAPQNDVVLFISYSGSTPELLNLLPHLLPTVRVMAMTSHLQVDDCPLLRTKADGILLPAPIPEKEEVALGVAAPTVSTTVALAVSDMLALSLAEQLNDEHPRQVFKRNHPGGTIGLTHQQVEQLDKDGVDFSVLELPSPSISGSDTG